MGANGFGNGAGRACGGALGIKRTIETTTDGLTFRVEASPDGQAALVVELVKFAAGEDEYQSRSAGRAMRPMRGASNGMSATPGMASRSAMLVDFWVSFW